MSVFWAVVVILGVAGLVSYENKKLIRELDETKNASTSTVMGQVLDDETLKQIAEKGLKEWSPQIVESHATLDDCWLIIRDGIYDVTEYVPFHPGGKQTILDYCGGEATKAFETRGGEGTHSQTAWKLLDNYYVAALGDALPSQGSGETAQVSVQNRTQKSGGDDAMNPNIPEEGGSQDSAPTPADDVPASPSKTLNDTIALTTATVATHNSISDCWLIIENKVYDVTAYIPFHPGGTNTIRNNCGKESTQAFATRGGEGSHSQSAWNMLNNYLLGNLDASVVVVPADPGTTSTPPPISSDPSEPYRDAIFASYPGASITKLSLEDNGYAEFKFIYNGNEYEGKMNASYVITEMEEGD